MTTERVSANAEALPKLNDARDAISAARGTAELIFMAANDLPTPQNGAFLAGATYLIDKLESAENALKGCKS